MLVLTHLSESWDKSHNNDKIYEIDVFKLLLIINSTKYSVIIDSTNYHTLRFINFQWNINILNSSLWYTHSLLQTVRVSLLQKNYILHIIIPQHDFINASNLHHLILPMDRTFLQWLAGIQGRCSVILYEGGYNDFTIASFVWGTTINKSTEDNSWEWEILW